MGLERDLIGYVIGGSLKEGITVRLTVPATTVREGGFVVIESLGVRYYGLSVNLSLRSADPRFSLERAELRFKPVYAAILNENTLDIHSAIFRCVGSLDRKSVVRERV